MKQALKHLLFIICIAFTSRCLSQNATFIILDNTKNLYKVTISSSGCTSTFLSFCTNFTGTPLSIALDGNILYVADNKGFLYKNTLGVNGTAGNCTKLGSFPITTGIYGLTVGNGGIVYAATGSTILTYNPATNAFATLGTMPSQWTIGGDLLFYQGKLYEAVKDGTTGNNALIEIDLTNVANSKMYMTFNAGTSVFGFASVIVPCQNNQSYALSSNGNTTDIFAVDMANKTQATTIFCSVNYNVYDAASVAETQSATPPVTVPLSFSSCTQVTYLGNVYTNSTTIKDTVKSVLGCDSIYHNVTIAIGNNIATIQTLILSGCNNVVYKGNTYTTNTILKDTIKSLMGCGDSIYNVVNINIITPKSDTLNLYDCDSVYYKGTWYNYPTTIYDTLKAVGGCDSLNLVVNVEIGMYKIEAYIPTWTSNLVPIDLIVKKVNQLIYTGGNSPEGIAISNNNEYAVVSHQHSAGIGIIKTSTNTLWSTIQTSSNYTKSFGICFSPNDSFVYVTNTTDGTIAIVDFFSKQLINEITVGTGPTSIACNENGTRLYVTNANDGTVSIINTSNYNIIKTLITFPFLNDADCIYNKKDKNLYVLNSRWGVESKITVISTLTNKITDTINLSKVGSKILLNKTGNLIFVANYWDDYISIVDVALKKTVDSFATGDSPVGLDMLKDNNTLLVVCSYDTSVYRYNLKNKVVEKVYKMPNRPRAFGNFIAYLKIKIQKDTLNLSSCTSITYKTKIYTSSTSFTDTTKSYRGCDSVYTLVNINIKPISTTTSTNNLSSCKSIVYNSTPYNSSTVLRDTIKNFYGCDSVYNITNIVITPINPATNITNLSNCKSITYQGNTYTTSTILRDTVKSYQGCDSIYNVANIVITPVIPVTNTNNLNHCKRIVYNSNTYTLSTVVRDTVRSLNGGCDSVYNIVNININPITPTNTNLSFSDCKQVVYKGKTYTSSTVVKDTTKSYQGCDSIYTVAAITIKSISPKTNTVNFSHCKRIVYNTISYTSSTILKDTLKSVQGCDSIYNIVNITITPIITTNYITVLSNCDSVVFRGITYFNSASVSDTLKSYQGCDSIYNIHNIIIQPKPTITVTKDIYVLPNTPITLTPNYTQDDSYSWNPATFLDDPTAKYPTCIPAKDITYKIEVFNAIGCSDTASLKIFVAKMPVIPNVFSPNGDGINDTWDIININTYPRNTVQVFNRYGRKIFSSFPGAYKAWNGKYNGKEVAIGVYYYIINLDPTKPILTGSITVLR